jgi:hypothetical protein
MSQENAEWSEKFAELCHDLEHHIEEEENDLFPKARKLIGDEAAEIGRRFQDAKQQWLRTQGEAEQESGASDRDRDEGDRARGGSERGGSSESGEEVSGLTRDELYERARKLGIEGRSKMTKSELVRAVRARG